MYLAIQCKIMGIMIDFSIYCIQKKYHSSINNLKKTLLKSIEFHTGAKSM